MTLSASVRPMEPGDVGRVAAIEAASFSRPWSEATLLSLLDHTSVESLVLEVPDAGVVGYAVVWCILDQGELANIAVDERWRGRGLGAILLDRALDRARTRGVERLFLEVRESNSVAAGLYASRGFIEIGRRRDYYDAPREDARVLQTNL